MTVARPKTLEQALQALSELTEPGERAVTVVAGGTDVMVEASAGHRTLADVVAVRRVAEMRTVHVDTQLIRVGAAVPYAELTGPTGMPRSVAPALYSAAASMGSTQIRSMGTLGGNVVTASPVGDSLCALLALDAMATLASSAGVREVPVAELIAESGGCSLGADELMIDLHWAPASGPQRFLKVGRRAAVSRSVVSVSVVAEAEGAQAGTVRIVVGGCAARPLRMTAAEEVAREAWSGAGFLSFDAAAAVAEAVTASLTPPSDLRGGAAYRRHVAGVMVRRALAGGGHTKRLVA
jgi:CO/xanthine dehydrogenase FAD-binding subunit